MNIKKIESGFTLIEIAIVLLIVSLILGYTVAMLPKQQELKRYNQAKAKMLEIKEHLIAFAQINGRLPCPDANTNGSENALDVSMNATGLAGVDGLSDSCVLYTGRVPSITLGMSGDLDANGNVTDPWGETYWYHISNVATLAGVVDLVSQNAIKNAGLVAVAANPPDLFVCDGSDAATNDNNDADCDDVVAVGGEVSNNVSVVLVSTGKDTQPVASHMQTENLDLDNVYVHSTFSDRLGFEYDDLVKWISPNILYSKMIEAGQLP